MICKSTDELREYLMSTGTDVEAEFLGHHCVMYADDGSANVSIDRAANYHPHKTWEEFLADPVFDGKTVQEILPDLELEDFD